MMNAIHSQKLIFKHLLTTAVSLLFCARVLYAQELLDNQNASWTTVLPGTVLSEPALTSYGFCLFTDSKTVTAISNKGTVLWEKSFSKTKNAFIYALPYDFILFFDNDKAVMKLINPSGTIVWETKIDFKVTSPNNIFAGRDGRFFLSSGSAISCYGMNGVCRWKVSSLSLKNMCAQELPDGSLIYFTAEKDGKTCGIRVSPFGEVMEEITFAGEIENAWWCSDGILLAFTDGTAGLFSLEGSRSKNKWVFSQKANGISFAVHSSKKQVCALLPAADGISANIIQAKNGTVENAFYIKNIDAKKLQKVYFNNSGILFADDKNCALYKTDGTMLWCGRFQTSPSKITSNFITYTADSHLLLCRKNWTLDAFKISQSEEKAAVKKTRISYPQYIQINTQQFSYLQDGFPASITDANNLASLKKGFYGTKEIAWGEYVLSASMAYAGAANTSEFGTHRENSVFDEDNAGMEKIVELLPYLATNDSAETAAAVIRSASNTSFLNAVLKGIRECGYDPDGKILSAIEEKSSRISSKNITTIENMCDAVYSVCIYMGKPAYFTKGSSILKNFMSANQDAKTRAYVREILKQLASTN